MHEISLVMSCTSLGRSEEAYIRDVTMANIAARFHTAIYPNANVFVGVDKKQGEFRSANMQGQLLAYDFSSHPFAMARMGFYRACCASDQVPEGPMMFTGIDVLSLKPLPNSFLEHNVVMSYRWHPTQPYCSDFIFVKDKKSGFDFFSAVIQCMGWMPREIHHGPADQLALALVMGHIKAYEFDGNSHQAPFYEGGVLVPGDDFFFCPGDYFSSKFQSGSLGERKDDLHVNLDALLNESSRKYMLHFKGDRKPGFFRFADEYCSSFENDRLLA